MNKKQIAVLVFAFVIIGSIMANTFVAEEQNHSTGFVHHVNANSDPDPTDADNGCPPPPENCDTGEKNGLNGTP